MEQYQVLSLIGEGSFGKVYKGRRKESRQVRSVSVLCGRGYDTSLFCMKGGSLEVHPEAG